MGDPDEMREHMATVPGPALWKTHGSSCYRLGSSCLPGHHYQIYKWGNRGTARQVACLKPLWDALSITAVPHTENEKRWTS